MGLVIRMVFFSSTVLFLLTTLLIRLSFKTIKKHPVTTNQGTTDNGSRHALGSILIICLVMVIIWICYEQWNSNVSVLMVAKHISVPKYSLLFTISTVEIILIQPFTTRLFKPSFKAEKMRIILGLISFALSYLAIINTGSYWRYVLGITLVTFGEMLALIAIPALLNRFADDRNRGTIQSVGSFAGSMGRALGPLFGGYFITAFDYSWTFLGMFIIHLLLIIPVFMLRMNKPK